MTIIAASESKGEVAIAADREWYKSGVRTSGPTKLHQCGDWVAGASGDAWSGEMLEDCMPLVEATTPDKWVHQLRDALLQWSRDHGHGTVEDGTWLVPWNVLIINANGGIWDISGDGVIMRPPDGYLAIGSGAPVATGALHARQGTRAVDHVRAAVEAACAHAEGCGRPIDGYSFPYQTTQENP